MNQSVLGVLGFCLICPTFAADPIGEDLTWPPKLPGGKTTVTVRSPKLLKPTVPLRNGVEIARVPPTVRVMYYPGQSYPGRPWSVWGEGLVVGDRYYSAIGDHLSPEGNASVYEYNSDTGRLRELVDVRSILNRPPGHYTPGKIHSMIGRDADGWLYFSTHRGSTRVGLDPNNHYAGDWILRHHPETGRSEVLAETPLPMQSLPFGFFDADRHLWYAGTADGKNENPPQFLVFDTEAQEVVYTDPHGPYRAAILARSGKVYLHSEAAGPGRPKGAATLSRFDPETRKPPTPIDAKVGLRAVTPETRDGIVYTIDGDELWAFDTRTETSRSLGPSAVVSETYTASLALDPKTERYLYYVPGAHGGAYRDGTPVVQFDVKTQTRKVIAFLHPAVVEQTDYIPMGTYSVCISPEGGRLYITWNGNRGANWSPKAQGKRPKIRFNTCALITLEIPETERSAK